MVSKGQGKLVLWPHYFDARRSREAGRRVPSAIAVPDPDARWVEAAARKAGLEVELQEEARHPSVPFRSVGRVLVSGRGGKQDVLRRVAQRMAAGKE